MWDSSATAATHALQPAYSLASCTIITISTTICLASPPQAAAARTARERGGRLTVRSQLPAPGWLAAHVRAAGIALRQRRCFCRCNCRARARRCFLKVGPAGAGAERSAGPCPCIRHACALASSPCTTMPCLRCPRTARCPPARTSLPTFCLISKMASVPFAFEKKESTSPG